MSTIHFLMREWFYLRIIWAWILGVSHCQASKASAHSRPLVCCCDGVWVRWRFHLGLIYLHWDTNITGDDSNIKALEHQRQSDERHRETTAKGVLFHFCLKTRTLNLLQRVNRVQSEVFFVFHPQVGPLRWEKKVSIWMNLCNVIVFLYFFISSY